MVNLDDYEPVTDEGNAYATGLYRIWERLGKPEDLSTSSGWVVLDQIVNVWMRAFRDEYLAWVHDRAIDLRNERSLTDHVKGGTYNPVTFPQGFYLLMKAMFPGVKLTDKEFQHQLAQRHPIFKSTNYKV